ncbi:Na+/H+ antiporter [Methylocapsa sp. S129]|uniref:Na+/H+ antiporter n=1 Tax=Methylocapsa sp. S129 TaxID=1641869 RepID=UPI00131E2E09|nr:Na+/H+ antiporter [Methylocapsa sp. S129]
MLSVHIIIALIMGCVPLAWIARRMGLPDPVTLVLGGAALAFIPGLPQIGIAPEIVFTVLLPPILYQAALHLPWGEFRESLRPILILAIGLVLATMAAIGLVAHWLIPTLPLAAAMVLGAILAATDPTAAIAVMRKLGAPRRVVTVVEGESIVNDATALVLFTLAVHAITTDAFSIPSGVVQFVFVAAGGALVGLVIAVLFEVVHSLLGDSELEAIWGIMLPFAAYLAADSVQTSGILAVLAAGMFRGWHSPEVLSARSRLIGFAIADVVAFGLNSLIFVLIGLQLRNVVTALSGYGVGRLALYSVTISAVLIALRMAWVLGSGALASLFRPIGERPMTFPMLAVVSWSGMRGILSLAAALAIPHTIGGGEPFPGRDLIVFLTFSAIVITLLLQSVTLRPLMKAIGLESDAQDLPGETAARREMAVAALKSLRRFARDSPPGTAAAASLKALSAQYLAEAPADAEVYDPAAQETRRQAQKDIVAAQQQRLIAMKHRGLVSDQVFLRLQRELDHVELSVE